MSGAGRLEAQQAAREVGRLFPNRDWMYAAHRDIGIPQKSKDYTFP